MVLGHSRILEEIKKRNLIEGVPESSIGGSGVDLRAKTFYRLRTPGELLSDKRTMPEITEVKENVLILKPGEYVLVETIEKVNMPSEIMALVYNRSSLFRCGMSLRTAVVDPGYKGTLTFGLKNESEKEARVERGARVCQIVFYEIGGTTKLYEGKYQGGKVV